MFCSSLNRKLNSDSEQFLSSIRVLNFRNSSYNPYFHVLLTTKVQEEFDYRFKKIDKKYSLYGELVYYKEIQGSFHNVVTCVVKWGLLDDSSKSFIMKNQELIVRVSNTFDNKEQFDDYFAKVVFNKLYKDLLNNLNVRKGEF